MKGEKSHSHFRNCQSLSQWLNPSPSTVNPTFVEHKRANPSSHFTPSEPSYMFSLNGMVTRHLVMLSQRRFLDNSLRSHRLSLRLG